MEAAATADAASLYDAAVSASTLQNARRNIEQLRQRDAVVRLVRRDGTPMAGVNVEVEQTENDFLVGDNTWTLQGLEQDGRGDSDAARAIRRLHAGLFNAANCLCYWTERPRHAGPKIEEFQGEYRDAGFTPVVDWCNASGMTAKGHPLVWSLPKAVPDWVLRYPPAERMKWFEVRVRNLVARYRGKVKLWDATNEALWEPAPWNLDERDWPHIEPIATLADYIEPALRWAREEDPAAVLVINDYGLEASTDAPHLRGVTAASQRQRLLQLAAELSDRGQPPDALGLQQHTAGWLSHDEQVAVYDELAAAGLPLHVTEFWANPDHLIEAGLPRDEADDLWSTYLENYLTVAFGHASIEAFFFWGLLGQAIQWKGGRNAADALGAYEPRPAYLRLQRLLRETWRTRERLTADAEGVIRFRGFTGEYTVAHAMRSGTSRSETFRLDYAASMPLTLTLRHG